MITVGGTLASRICGLSRWGGPLSAYFELTADVQAEQLPAMRRGVVLEESVLELWVEATARDLSSLVRPKHRVTTASMQHAHATLDAYHVTLDTAHADLFTLLDAKTVSRESMGPEWGEDGSDQIPEEYRVQLLWYLGVCKAAGMNVADEALLPTLCGPEVELQWATRLVEKTGKPLAPADLEGTGLELRVYRVEWDAEIFAALNARVVRFLREHVEPRIPPPPGAGDLLERDMRAVARGLRAEPGRVLDFERLNAGTQALLTELLEANRQRKAWTNAEEQAAARVRLAMATAEEVRGLPGGARVVWKDVSGAGRRFEVREPKGRKA